MILVNTKDLKIFCDKKPKPDYRMIFPGMSKEEKEDIEKYPFILEEAVNMIIWYKNKWYDLFFEDEFKWNGSDIPKYLWRFMGSNADPRYLLASMPHDLVCKKRYLIDNNRLLSSLIFKEILLACGVNSIKAQVMFVAVDNFQKLQNWNKSDIINKCTTDTN